MHDQISFILSLNYIHLVLQRQIGSIFFDMRQAFDKFPNVIPLETLDNIGLLKHYVTLFQSYFSFKF
jgi:hypothetical protein